MIFSTFTYNGITFSRFIRGSGFQADAITGDRIQIRSTRDPLPAQDGIQRYLDYYGSRLLEIRGWVKGTSESDLYDNINALIAAFDIHALETSGNYGFQPLQWTDPGQGSSRYNVKPLNNTLTVSEQRTGLARGFSVLLEAKDPIKYTNTSTTTTITISTVGGSSSAFPFIFPVIFSSIASFGVGTITNTGSVAVFPQSIKLYGFTGGTWVAPKITNSTNGEFIQFTSTVTLTSGQYVLVDPAVGTAQKYNGSAFEDVTAYITSDSTFWKVEPGSNTIRIEGSATVNGDYAEITVISST